MSSSTPIHSYLPFVLGNNFSGGASPIQAEVVGVIRDSSSLSIAHYREQNLVCCLQSTEWVIHDTVILYAFLKMPNIVILCNALVRQILCNLVMTVCHNAVHSHTVFPDEFQVSVQSFQFHVIRTLHLIALILKTRREKMLQHSQCYCLCPEGTCQYVNLFSNAIVTNLHKLNINHSVGLQVH